MASKKILPKTKKPATGLCEALVMLSKGEFDAKTIATILGDETARTLPDVAKAFGVRPSTVRQSWRLAGMPGSTGNYKLADVLLWRLERDLENEKYINSTRKPKSRLSEIELEKAELDLENMRDKFLERRGEVVPVWQVRAEVSVLLTNTRKVLLNIPRSMMPLFPADLETGLSQELEREINKALTYLAEQKIHEEKIGEAYDLFRKLQESEQKKALSKKAANHE